MAFGYDATRTQPAAMAMSAAAGNNDECIKLLQKIITDLDMFMHYSNDTFLNAQQLFLMGEKREERDFVSNAEYCLYKDYQSAAIDFFDAEIKPEEKRLQFAKAMSFEQFFVSLKQKLWYEYQTLHKHANDLVVMGYKPLSCALYGFCECLWDIICDTQRTIKRGALSGWSVHDVLIYQTEFRSKHDYYEKKMKKLA